MTLHGALKLPKAAALSLETPVWDTLVKVSQDTSRCWQFHLHCWQKHFQAERNITLNDFWFATMVFIFQEISWFSQNSRQGTNH